MRIIPRRHLPLPGLVRHSKHLFYSGDSVVGSPLLESFSQSTSWKKDKGCCKTPGRAFPLKARQSGFATAFKPSERPYFYWHYTFDQLILTDEKTMRWFHNPSTGIPLKLSCNLARSPFAYGRLKRAIEQKNPLACAPSVKLGLRDKRRHVPDRLSRILQEYYDSFT